MKKENVSEFDPVEEEALFSTHNFVILAKRENFSLQVNNSLLVLI